MVSLSGAATPAAFVAALNARDPAQAAAIGHAMLAKGVALGAQWGAVARFAASEGEWPLAIGAMRAVVANNPMALDARLGLAEILTNAGRVSDAVVVLSSLAEIMPNDPRVRHFLGIALIESGQRDVGIEHLRAALHVRPGSGATWLALANATPLSQPGDRNRLEQAMTKAASGERAMLHYALGKALDDAGEFDRAFAAFADGARLIARDRLYDAATDRKQAMATIKGVPNAIDRPAGQTTNTRAMFVTGKPRSGTTLVEQILANDDTVVGGGEINILNIAARAHGAADGIVVTTNPASLTSFRNRYNHLAVCRFSAKGRFVDKSLNTSRFAGFLRSAMSDAPLVWVRRDPLDTAWSSFRTYFATGLGWSFDLVAMARFHAVEDALHAFWHDIYGPQLLTIDYADLVMHPDVAIARLQTHCGLTQDLDARDFHKKRRTVQTASVAQVRRPINRDGIDTAAPYRARLGPFLQAYAKARTELGLPGL